MTGKRSGKLAFCGVMTALAVALLLLTATPVSTVALAALAAVCGIPVVVEAGKKAALLHVAAVAVLALLLVPAWEGKLMYIALFGWYTVFKAWLESKRLPWAAEWIIKLGAFLVSLPVWYLLVCLFTRQAPSLSFRTESALWLAMFCIIWCGVFLVYDRGLSGLVRQYMLRLHPSVSRLFRFT